MSKQKTKKVFWFKSMWFHIFMIAYSILNIKCIWPPEYKINLNHEEEFIISELLDRSDVQDVYDEEEMIKNEEIKSKQYFFEKYFRLHRQSNKENIRIQKHISNYILKSDKTKNSVITFKEANPDAEDSQPWIGGIVNEKHNFKKEYDMFYFDDEAKSNKTESGKLLHKRNPDNSSNSSNDYENLKSEYIDQIKKAESKNDTLKYKDVKEDESPGEAAKTLVDFQPRNCSEEEKKGIGYAAVKCFWIETRNKHNKKDKNIKVLQKLLGIVAIWVMVYLIIALPLWCQYGWCCCCCRCKFCRPRDQIEEVKNFFANNPVGVYHPEKGNVVTYTPTNYEIYAQKNLDKAIHRL